MLFRQTDFRCTVPKNQWVAKEDDVLPNGTVIKAGEYVRWGKQTTESFATRMRLLIWRNAGDWEMGRSQALWGPDAQEFKPSRWITEEGGLMQTDMVCHFRLERGTRSLTVCRCSGRVTGSTVDPDCTSLGD